MMQRFFFSKHIGGYSTAIAFDVSVESIIPLLNNSVFCLKGLVCFTTSETKIKEQEIYYIKKGLEKIIDLLPVETLFIIITEAYWSWADYQSNLWELAIVEWACKEFEIPLPQYEMWNDEKSIDGKFIFRWK